MAALSSRARARVGGTAWAGLVAACVAVAGTGCGAAAPAVWPPPLPPQAVLDPEAVRLLEEIAARPAPAPAPPPRVRDPEAVAVEEGELEGIRYLEVRFGDPDPDEPLPTIWVLHGRGDRARIPGGPFWALPRPVRVFVPQAPDALGDGFTWFPVRVAEGRTEELSVAIVDRVARLARMMDALREARPTIGRPIVTGFSQGGVLSFALALLHPESVGRALPLAGWLPPGLVPDLSEPARFPPIRALHGTADERIAYPPTRELVDALVAAGLDAELVPFADVTHVMTEAMDALVRAWLVSALGGDAPRDALAEEGGRVEPDRDERARAQAAPGPS
ncbi:MAG: dienelactone hydrolase family protein [Sandaracinaceae bacterium]|nr:dienelactone hydrolase family protein [Sandaracinaceae bacterium]